MLDCISNLSIKEQYIIKLHFGLLGMSPMKNKDISELLNIDSSNVGATVSYTKNRLIVLMKKKREEKYIKIKQKKK